MSEQSPLSNLSRGQVAEIVDYLRRDIESLLRIIVEAEMIFGGGGQRDRPAWGDIQFARELKALSRDAKILSQQHAASSSVPQCISSPKILGAPDLSVVYEHLHELRAQRRNLSEHVKYGAWLGSEESIYGVSEDLLNEIEVTRAILEEVYSSRILFSGELRQTK